MPVPRVTRTGRDRSAWEYPGASLTSPALGSSASQVSRSTARSTTSSRTQAREQRQFDLMREMISSQMAVLRHELTQSFFGSQTTHVTATPTNFPYITTPSMSGSNPYSFSQPLSQPLSQASSRPLSQAQYQPATPIYQFRQWQPPGPSL